MDAVKFFLEYIRLCKTNRDSQEWMCNNKCPMYDNCDMEYHILVDDMEYRIRDMVEAVKKWSNEHPPKTNGVYMNEISGNKFCTNVPIHDRMKQIWVDADWWDSKYEKE